MSDTISSTGTVEHRNSERALVHRRGWIARTKGEQLRECTVSDKSTHGARIIVDNPRIFPTLSSSTPRWNSHHGNTAALSGARNDRSA